MSNIPLQITFRSIEPSDFVAARVREEVAQLGQFYSGIMGCRVVIELLTKRHHQGNIFNVKVEMKVPGEEVIAGNPSIDGAHEDAYVAIRDAFDAAKRQLEDYVRRHRVRVHLREQKKPPRGRVIRLLANEDSSFGFLMTPDGREIYFHRNSVLNNHFDDLKVGSIVRFAEEEGEKGPQASTVEMLKSPRKRLAS